MFGSDSDAIQPSQEGRTGVPVIHLETIIDAPLEDCFALSLAVDAHTASMSGSRERAVGGVIEGELQLGDVVTWRAIHFGIPWRLTSKITEHEAPHRFVDIQVTGPFAHWRHEHRFELLGTSTRMVDTVDFASPFGVIGSVVDRLFLRRYMERILTHRNAWLKAELEEQLGQ